MLGGRPSARKPQPLPPRLSLELDTADLGRSPRQLDPDEDLEAPSRPAHDPLAAVGRARRDDDRLPRRQGLSPAGDPPAGARGACHPPPPPRPPAAPPKAPPPH